MSNRIKVKKTHKLIICHLQVVSHGTIAYIGSVSLRYIKRQNLHLNISCQCLNISFKQTFPFKAKPTFKS